MQGNIMVSFSAFALAYPGFHLFPEWDGSSLELPSMHCPNLTCFKYLSLSNGQLIPPNVAKYFCDNDPDCDNFGGWAAPNDTAKSGIVLRSRPKAPEFDTYIGTNKSIVPNAQCHLEEGACIASHMWLACDVDVFAYNDVYQDCAQNIIASYPLPADDIHMKCLAAPECIGFRVKKDGSSGDLFANVTCKSPGYFALPP
jgi:hypothetical protein